MVDEPDSLIITMLRRSEERMIRIDKNVDRLLEDMHDIKVRMTHVEEGVAGINRRLDRLEVRVDRIEKRLELVDSGYGGVRE